MLLEMELICLELLCQKNYIVSRKGKEEGRKAERNKSVELHSWSSQYTRESSLAIHSNLILSQ